MGTNFFQMLIPQYFGVGAAKEVGEKLKELGCKNVLITYDKGVEAAGIPARIVEYIQASGIQTVTSNEVESDPSDKLIVKLTELAKKEQVDGVVAVGGGSSIDAAKGVKLLLNNGGNLQDYYNPATPQKGGIPMIAIPTTSGSGSEASKGSVVTDSASNSKKVIIGMGTIPDMALVDPELTLGLPPKITAACAFDVLAHAIDAITSNMTNPITQSVAYEAIHLMKRSYQRACTDGSDLAARSDMHLAANLGGIALANAKCSISHSFAHAMGSVYRLHHGVCCAIFTPACLEFVADVCQDEVVAIADLLEVPYQKGDSSSQIAKVTAETIQKMFRAVGIPHIAELIPDQEDACQKIIPLAFADIMTRFSPRALDDEGARWIMDRTYQLAELG